LTFSNSLRVSAINIGPEEMRRTRPIRILAGFSCARTIAGALTANETAALPARRLRRSIFILSFFQRPLAFPLQMSVPPRTLAMIVRTRKVSLPRRDAQYDHAGYVCFGP